MEYSIGGDGMRIIDLGNMLSISAEYGYILHNINEDIYSDQMYVNKQFDLSVLEEVRDEDAIDKLYRDIDILKQKETSLDKIGKLVAKQVTDDATALEIMMFYDEWMPDTKYTQNEYLLYKNVLYKSLSEHTSQKNWKPDITPSLYAKVLVDPTGETILEWQQPNSTNPYMKGDKVTHNSVTYISTVDNNVWEPGVYGWEIVEES